MFEDEAFWDTFGKAIDEKYPSVKESLRNRMKDLENHDCEIVIAGNAFYCTLISKKITADKKFVVYYTLINTLLTLLLW